MRFQSLIRNKGGRQQMGGGRHDDAATDALRLAPYCKPSSSGDQPDRVPNPLSKSNAEKQTPVFTNTDAGAQYMRLCAQHIGIKMLMLNIEMQQC